MHHSECNGENRISKVAKGHVYMSDIKNEEVKSDIQEESKIVQDENKELQDANESVNTQSEKNGKIKEFFRNNTVKSYVDTFKIQPITFICILFTTLYFALCLLFIKVLDDNYVLDAAFGIGIGSLLTVFASFFIESALAKVDRIVHIISIVCIGVINSFVVGPAICGFDEMMTSLYLGKTSMRFTLVILGLYFASFIFSIYFINKRNSETSLSSFGINVITKWFIASVIYGLASIGVLILFIIVSMLFQNADTGLSLVGALMVILTGGYYAISLHSALVEKKDKPDVFGLILSRYVLFPWCLLFYLIVYIYMLTIIISQEYPSNSIFGCITFLFVISIPLSYVLAEYKDEAKGKTFNRVISKIARFIPYVFLLLIPMQVISLVKRIDEYGLTPKRYFGIVMILIEIVYIIIYTNQLITKWEKTEIIFLIISLAIAFALVFPGINAFTLSNELQLKRITDYINNYYAKRARSAFDYLEDEGEGYLKKFYTEKEIEDIDAYLDKREYTSADRESIALSTCTFERFSRGKTDYTFDVEGYNHVEPAMIAVLHDIDCNPIDLKAVDLYTGDRLDISQINGREIKADVFRTVDVSEYAKKLIEIYTSETIEGGNKNEAAMELPDIILDENSKFFVTEMRIYYKTEGDHEVAEIDLRGYYIYK